MKKIILAILILAAVLPACKKSYPGDSYDFTNSVAPYVELKSKAAVSAKQGTTFPITVQMRTSQQAPVTVGYSITGGFTQQGTVTIDRNKTSGTATITVPANIIPAGGTTATAVLQLTTAKAGTTDLTVGRLGTDKEKITVTVTQ